MKPSIPSAKQGFTLLETVIAIGVLAVLLSGFMVVFAPAAEGIKRSLNVQQSDRLAATVEKELTNLRGGQTSVNINNGFDKAFEWIKRSETAATALLVYQYRGDHSSLRSTGDGTPTPVASLNGNLPGAQYQVTPILRQLGEANIDPDLTAVEGTVYVVKCRQLIFNGAGDLVRGASGQIADPFAGGTVGSAAAYNHSVITFSAEFYALPSNSSTYVTGAGLNGKFGSLSNPVFTRNLTVRR